MKPIYFSLFLICTTPLCGQFFLNGTATITEDSCFQLTDAINNQVGSIWYPDKIDLRNSFDLVMEIFLGCQDVNGADGIVFGLQPVSTSIGSAGGGIGFGGVQPALGVEFDTWQNLPNNDPIFDHIAIMANGQVAHLGPNNLAGPVQARANSPNAENCSYIPFRITWDAPSLTLRVYFDCELRLSYTGDIVNDIFGGDPLVFYGFTSATGGANNRHEVCFRFNSFLDQLQDVVVCPGGQAILDVSGGARYEWTPSTGLDDPTAPSVIASPDSTTTYAVRIFDDCDIPLFDTATVTVAGDSVFFDLGPDTTLCEGDGLSVDVTTPTAVYTWSDSTIMGPTPTLFSVGTYAVTVTRTDTFCTAADRVTLAYRPLPVLDLGPDTTLCEGEVMPLVAVFPEAVGIWQDGRVFDTLFVSRTGVYSVALEHPCAVVFDRIAVDFENCREVFLPNAFSPNGDGINDQFFPQDGGDVSLIHALQIFDRWGGLVFSATEFSSNSPAFGWDGQIKGRPAAPGVYLWQLDTSFKDGTRLQSNGTVNLIR